MCQKKNDNEILEFIEVQKYASLNDLIKLKILKYNFYTLSSGHKLNRSLPRYSQVSANANAL